MEERKEGNDDKLCKVKELEKYMMAGGFVQQLTITKKAITLITLLKTKPTR